MSSLDLLGKNGDSKQNLNFLQTKENKQENKKEEQIVDDKFKAFDFISKQQARLLIEILKQPVFFNMLPPEAQNIVKVILIYLVSK